MKTGTPCPSRSSAPMPISSRNPCRRTGHGKRRSWTWPDSRPRPDSRARPPVRRPSPRGWHAGSGHASILQGVPAPRRRSLRLLWPSGTLPPASRWILTRLQTTGPPCRHIASRSRDGDRHSSSDRRHAWPRPPGAFACRPIPLYGFQGLSARLPVSLSPVCAGLTASRFLPPQRRHSCVRAPAWPRSDQNSWLPEYWPLPAPLLPS